MIAKLIIKFRYFIIAALLLITAFFLWNLIPLDKISFNFDFRRLVFKENDPKVKKLDFLRETFGNDIAMLVVFLELPENWKENNKSDSPLLLHTVFEPRYLTLLNELTEKFKHKSGIDKNNIISLTQATDLHADSITPAVLKKIIIELEDIRKDKGDDYINKALKFFEKRNLNKIDPEILSIFERLLKIKTSLLEHKIYRGQILSNDGLAAAIIARIENEYYQLPHIEPFYKEIETWVNDKNSQFTNGEKFYYTGVPIVQFEYKRIAQSDLKTFPAVILFIIAVLIYLLFRSFVFTVLVILVVSMAVIWNLGLMQLCNEPIDMINSCIPMILLILGLSDSIYILARYSAGLVRYHEKEETLRITINRMLIACFLTSITNAVGFGSLITASIPTIQKFGLFSSTGCMFVFLAITIGLGVCLAVTKAPDNFMKYEVDQKDWVKQGSRKFEKIADFVIKRKYYVAIFFVSLALISIPGIIMVDKETRLLEELKPDNPYYISTKAFERKLSGVLPYDLLFEGVAYPDMKCSDDSDCRKKECHDSNCRYSGCCNTAVCVKKGQRSNQVNSQNNRKKDSNEDEIIFVNEDPSFRSKEIDKSLTEHGICVESVKNIDFLIKLREFEEMALDQKKYHSFVSNVTSLSNFLEELYSGYTGKSIEESRINETWTRALISQMLLALEANDSTILKHYVDSNYTITHLSINTKDIGSKFWYSLREDTKKFINEHFENNVELKNKFKISMTGTTILAEEALSKITSDLIKSLLFAVVIIAILMSLLFRSLKIGLVAMLPNIIPLFLTFGFMGITGITLRTGTAIIYAISFGIVVNDTIHLLVNFTGKIQAGKELEEALKLSLKFSGRAMILSSFILICGFSIMYFSDFIVLNHFGLLISFTIFCAFLSDILLTPALILIFRLDKSVKKQAGTEGNVIS